MLGVWIVPEGAERKLQFQVVTLNSNTSLVYKSNRRSLCTKLKYHNILYQKIMIYYPKM